MRIAYSLGSLLTVNDITQCANILSNYKVDTIWIPETWGMENFAILSAISQITNSKIGSSIINIYSRSPSLVAMGAATIDTLSNGRLILGLGASSIPIVQNFHGLKLERPLERMKEYIEIIRLVLSGSKVNYQGKIFTLKGFKLLINPPRNDIPIYLAAVNKKMTELTWNKADGVIFYLRPLPELKKTVKKMQSKRKIDVACQIITSVSKDSEKAIQRAKKTLAFYISVGKIYRDFLAENGYRNETQNIYEEFTRTGLDMNHELVTKSMLENLTICGEPEECKKQISLFEEAGIDLPIIQFNPTGKVTESCKLFADTFSRRHE